jgi:hypothetical protein
VGEGLPPPAGEPDPDPDSEPDPDPEPGITGAGAPVHGSVDVPGAPEPLATPFGAEGFELDKRLCL